MAIAFVGCNKRKLEANLYMAYGCVNIVSHSHLITCSKLIGPFNAHNIGL